MVTAVEHYINLLIKLAEAKGRILAPLDPTKLERRFNEADATLFADGLDGGLLSIDAAGYLVTRDPYQATAWLVEGNPAWPCWEYLPHGAAYVELIDCLGFPSWAVRFETPGSEHNIDADLAVLDKTGRVLIMGEAKKEARELDKLLVQLKQYFAVDPGPPPTRHRDKAAWKLAHRLWITRAPWLWLVAPAIGAPSRSHTNPWPSGSATRYPQQQNSASPRVATRNPRACDCPISRRRNQR
jgi:hypothetical protein